MAVKIYYREDCNFTLLREKAIAIRITAVRDISRIELKGVPAVM